MSIGSLVPWSDDFLGVAYRYYDLRMNIVPLFTEKRRATDLWNNIIRFWINPSIRIRFVESGDRYWFVMASESKNPDSNRSFFKMLAHSENYERFKHGHDGEAYLRFGVYSKKYFGDVKSDAICNCGHEKGDHDDEDEQYYCLYESCDCDMFESFQVHILGKKKTVTDIRFLNESEAKDDQLAWNCLNSNEYNL